MQSSSLSSLASIRLESELLAGQLPDGGWSTYDLAPADTESTAFASLALAARAKAAGAERPALLAAADRGFSWLAKRQQADGGWPLNDQVPGSTWTTAPATLALAVVGRDTGRVGRGAAFLVSRRGSGDPLAGRILRWLTRAEDPRRVSELDPTIPAWAWTGDSFTWAEPTALAVLALRAALVRGSTADREAANRRISNAVRWFADRMAPGGGWNYGSRRVLDQDVNPYPDTTAWALLALHSLAGEDLVAESLARLHELMKETRSPLARALAVLAHRAYGEDTRTMTRMLASQCAGQSSDTPAHDTRSRALALLVLSGPPRPFEIT